MRTINVNYYYYYYKQLNHRFLHFVVSLQNKFSTLAPTFVFDVNTYFSSSRLFTIDPSLSLLQGIQYRQEITCQKPRPRRVPPASAGARRRVRAASRPHPTRVRPASAGARRRVYPRELLAFVACGRVDDVNI